MGSFMLSLIKENDIMKSNINLHFCQVKMPSDYQTQDLM